MERTIKKEHFIDNEGDILEEVQAQPAYLFGPVDFNNKHI